jgi:hypothetical protein
MVSGESREKMAEKMAVPDSPRSQEFRFLCLAAQ